jgi:hypothetical protein
VGIRSSAVPPDDSGDGYSSPNGSEKIRRMGTRKQRGHPFPPPGADQGVQNREMLPHLYSRGSLKKRAGFPDGGTKRKTM